MPTTRSVTRWTSVLLLVLCLVLISVTRHQAMQIESLRAQHEGDLRQDRAQRAAMADLQAELESLRVELAVRNVLDAHNIDVSRDKLQSISQSIIQVSHRYDLKPELILGLISTESSFQVRAESPKGAVGLMQLMPRTAAAMAEDLQLEWQGQQLLTDPQINILLGSFYLRQLMRRFRGLDHALAAYNLGPARLQSLLKIRSHPGASYVRRVQEAAKNLKETYF